MKDARLAAFDLLYSILKDGAYSNIAIDKALCDVSAKDKGLVSNLVYGVIERKITLDFLIDKYLDIKPKPKVKLVLYIGAYQLYFMDKIPSSAAINTSVELAANVGMAYYKKLVNAVLHKIDDNRIDIDEIEDLSVKYSCPTHLINMWKKGYGEENTLKILSAINGRPPVFAIPNTLYLDAEELQYELLNCGIECEIADGAVMINSHFDLNSCKQFENGLFHIQDLSSFKCATALEAKDGDTVLDICSAPGGKAFTIAERMNNTGCVYAFDLHEHRVRLIADGAKRLGITNIKAQVNDALEYNPDIPKCDRILCDVPCSGFGIIRRKPEIRYKELDSVKELPKTQYKILKTSSMYLKDGGRIIYSTCTLNKRENEKVVERFLNENEDFTLVFDKTFYPEANGGDGFYFAVMEKKND
ncbi:MAG: 16S rRNA (cytosine(967)-C(5))-methyltransferase RsmB [Eubacterium sp.]|nr:16S rRNA (cytosine(967)-C(5))-methyltransferase RsmB [Eubacterium sp.]